MSITRKICTTLAAAALGLGLLGMTAPAHADTSWGGRIATQSHSLNR